MSVREEVVKQSDETTWSEGLPIAVKVQWGGSVGHNGWEPQAGAVFTLHDSASKVGVGQRLSVLFSSVLQLSVVLTKGQATAHLKACLLPTLAGVEGDVSVAWQSQQRDQREKAQWMPWAQQMSWWSYLNGPGPPSTLPQPMELLFCCAFYVESNWFKRDYLFPNAAFCPMNEVHDECHWYGRFFGTWFKVRKVVEVTSTYR